MQLTVSFGTNASLAVITKVDVMSWQSFAAWLTVLPPEHTDKAMRGWYCPVAFNPIYRDSDNFVARHAITFDFDHVPLDTWAKVLDVWSGLAFAMYTTWSHTEEKPRFRVVMPLSRPATYDEFQAVARRVATDIDIELFARESFTPAQMMFAPSRKPGGVFRSHVNEGDFLDVDAVLAEYVDWTKHETWPHRRDHDGVHKADAQTAPDEKPGVIGDFCRTFTVQAAIKRFELPYEPTNTEDRWTYTAGSRPEGAIVYDDGLKLHSHHDTDPAHGQNNAFDLVRLHRFASLDSQGDSAAPVTERPSYKAMCSLALEQPELRQKAAADDFAALGDLGAVVEQEVVVTPQGERTRFLVQEAIEFGDGPPMRWIVKGVLPRAEMVVLYGESGAGKSFLALDLAAAITRGIEWRGKKVEKGNVIYVAAEGAGGFRQRLRAYAQGNNCALTELPAVIADAPNMLETADVAAVAHAIGSWGARHGRDGAAVADVIVLDTLAAVAPGSNENGAEDMGMLISHGKFLHQKTGAMILWIHHAGKDPTRGARGWSGLRAAADAEILVARNGDYRVAMASKQKDSVDGEQWPFKLTRVVLGLDDEGDEISSCVVTHTEDIAPSGNGKARPSGKYEPIVLETLQKMSVGTSVDLDDLLAGCIKHLAQEADGRDTRKRNAKRGLDGLLAKKLAFMHEGRVSLTSVRNADDGAFAVAGED